MKFTDELRAKEKEPLPKPPPKAPTQEELDRAERKETLKSGAATKEVYERVKKELLRSIELDKVLKNATGNSKPDKSDKYHTFTYIYKKDEYLKKEKAYHEKYCHHNETEEYRKPFEKQDAFLAYYLPHCVFSFIEVELIKLQLAQLFKEDGFHFTFKDKEYKHNFWSGFRESKSYGYTLNFTLWWDY